MTKDKKLNINMDKQTMFQRMYDESAVMLQSDNHSVDRINEAEERLNRMASLAEEENMNISPSLISVCESGLAREVNSMVAQKLDVQPTVTG